MASPLGINTLYLLMGETLARAIKNKNTKEVDALRNAREALNIILPLDWPISLEAPYQWWRELKCFQYHWVDNGRSLELYGEWAQSLIDEA